MNQDSHNSDESYKLSGIPPAESLTFRIKRNAAAAEIVGASLSRNCGCPRSLSSSFAVTFAVAGFVWAIADSVSHRCGTELIYRMSLFIPTIALFSGTASLLQLLVRFRRRAEAHQRLLLYAAAPIVTTFSFLAAMLLLAW